MIRRLSIFTRYPTPGETKTRLIPALGARGAAALHERLARQVVEQARALPPALEHLEGTTELEVSFAGADASRMRAWLGDDLRCVPQRGEDLGQRMLDVFLRAEADGVDAAVLIGTDLPELRTAHLVGAFAALADHDLVLGPAADGGYYLIGMRRAEPRLFEGPSWSTDRVLAETLARAEAAELTVASIDRLSDLDRPEDLRQTGDEP